MVAGVPCGPLVGRCLLTAGARGDSVVEAVRLLADWRAELGYLQHADAVQMLSDTFGDRFVRPSASGCGCIRCDVLAALHTLAPAPEWINLIDCCDW